MGSCASKNAIASTTTAPVVGISGAAAVAAVDNTFDSLFIDQCTRLSLEKATLSRQRMAWLRTNMHIEEVYDILEVIGQGSISEVSIVAKKKESLLTPAVYASTNTPRQYACKSVSTIRMNKEEIEEFINEIEILREMVHPNIIQMFEIYNTKHKIWIVTELCTGGDLGEYARRQHDTASTQLTEWRIADVMEQILRAVAYMHQHNICHRDLKFENIMLMEEDNGNNSKNPPIVIKLIDFGLGEKFTKGTKMNKACGTFYSAAPEILLQSSAGYTEKADIWSVGVLAFTLLSGGQYPFLKDKDDLRDKEKREKLQKAEYAFPQDRSISLPGRTFVCNSLKRYPGARWSAAKALTFVQNEWTPALQGTGSSSSRSDDGDQYAKLPSFKDSTNTSSTPNPSPGGKKQRIRMETQMLNGISTYATTYGEFKKRVLLAMAYQLDKTSISELRDVFFEIDSNNRGTLTVDEFKGALDKMHADKHLSAATIEKMFKGIDVDNSGTIHYHEFLAALLESQGMITQERLADVFERLDSEGKGYISKENLKNILGSDYNSKLVDKMIKETANNKNDGKINYEEFLRVMFNQSNSKHNAFFQR